MTNLNKLYVNNKEINMTNSRLACLNKSLDREYNI